MCSLIERMRRGTPLASVVLLGLWGLLVGCQSSNPPPPAPPGPPAARSGAYHFSGSPLSGPTTRPIATTNPSAALSVRVTIIATEKAATGGEPLAGQARLLSASRGGSPVLPSARLTREARVAAASVNPETSFGDVGTAATMLAEQGAVPPGATAVFNVFDLQIQDDPVTGEAWQRGVGLLVHRAGLPLLPATQPSTQPGARTAPPVELALAIEDAAILAVGTGTDDKPSTRPSRQREVVIIERPDPSVGGPISVAFALPFRFEGAPQKGVILVAEISNGSTDPEHVAATDRAIADLTESNAAAMRRSALAAAFGGDSAGLLVAVHGLTDPARQRASLVYLAGQTGANLCSDVVLSGDGAIVARIAEQVYGQLGSGVGPFTPAALGWILDRTSFQVVGAQMAAGNAGLELRAVLSTHAGEAGRNSSSIEQVSRGLTTRADFDARLVGENLIFLEDSSPSARVRAFDWLNLRGLAPPGYDPLGTPKSRRIAIEKARNQPPAAPTAVPTGGAK